MNQLTHTPKKQKKQIEYIQGQTNKIRNSVEARQSRIAWQTVNEVNKRKRTSRAKLKAASQEERIHLWKELFKNLLGKTPKVTDGHITEILYNQTRTVYSRRNRRCTKKN